MSLDIVTDTSSFPSVIAVLNTGRAQGYVSTSATSSVVVRATTYTPQGTNAQRSVKSTSTSDAAAGTGAQTVQINYLDASFNLHSEVVTLNGTTGVNTVGTNIAYIESMQVLTCGSGGSNAGIIEIMTLTGGSGSVWGSIAAGDNLTFWAHHYVPAGLTCYILDMTTGATAVGGYTNILHYQNIQATNLLALQAGVTLIHGTNFFTVDHSYEIPLAFPGPDLIWLSDRPTAVTASSTFAGFEYIQF